MPEPPFRLAFPLFGPLGADDAAALGPLLRPRHYASGRSLFQRGDPAEELYLVTAGQFRISVCSADGRELAFRVAGPGEMMGEIAVLDDSPRSADVTAIRPSEVVALSRDDLHRLIASHPAMAWGVIRFLCGRLRETSDQLESLALEHVEVRLARFLLQLLQAPPAASSESVLSIGLSQSEIASLIGASRPKVNLAFATLEEQGAIRREGKALTCRPSRLREIVGIVDP